MEGKVSLVVNVALAVVLGFLLFGPQGAVRPTIDRWQEASARAERLEALWPQISEVAMHVAGPQDAPLVVEVGDYYCPVCRQAEVVLNQPDTDAPLRMAFLHLPLDVHPHAAKAARIALCAEKAGEAAAVHKLLMELPLEAEPDVDSIARVSGIPSADLRLCEQSDSIENLLRGHIELATRAQVPGTPTYLGPEDWRIGVTPWNELVDLAER